MTTQSKKQAKFTKGTLEACKLPLSGSYLLKLNGLAIAQTLGNLPMYKIPTDGIYTHPSTLSEEESVQRLALCWNLLEGIALDTETYDEIRQWLTFKYRI